MTSKLHGADLSHDASITEAKSLVSMSYEGLGVCAYSPSATCSTFGTSKRVFASHRFVSESPVGSLAHMLRLDFDVQIVSDTTFR